MSEPLAPLPWQQETWRQLSATLEAGRLPHALLLAGPRNIGKRRLALLLAARLVCEQPAQGLACGRCRGCALLAGASHPNATLLTLDGHFCLSAAPDGRRDEAIPLWQPEKDSKKREVAADGVRDLIQRLGLSSHYGGAKVALIDPADQLSRGSAEALLKTVEEPPAGTHLILVTEAAQSLTPTLRSRCRILRLAPPPRAQALAWLQAQYPQADARVLGAVARRPLAAATLLEAGAVERRKEWARAMAELAAGNAQAVRLADKVKREDAQQWLEWLLAAATGWLRARLAGAREAGPAAAETPALLQLLDDALEGLRGLERNGSPTLIMESIMIRWWRSARERAA